VSSCLAGWLKVQDPSYLEELWDILEGVHTDLEISNGVVYSASFRAALGSSPNAGRPPVRSQPCSPLSFVSQRHRDSHSLPKVGTRTFTRVRGYEGDRLRKACKIPTVRSSLQGIDKRSYQAAVELAHLVDT